MLSTLDEFVTVCFVCSCSLSRLKRQNSSRVDGPSKRSDSERAKIRFFFLRNVCSRWLNWTTGEREKRTSRRRQWLGRWSSTFNASGPVVTLTICETTGCFKMQRRTHETYTHDSFSAEFLNLRTKLSFLLSFFFIFFRNKFLLLFWFILRAERNCKLKFDDSFTYLFIIWLIVSVNWQSDKSLNERSERVKKYNRSFFLVELISIACGIAFRSIDT